LTIHKIFVNEGEFLPGQEYTLTVDREVRFSTARNHTCTHLLHAALRKALGEHVKQSGSLVGPDRLRFDFTHIAPLSTVEVRLIEEEVNRSILADVPVTTRVMAAAEAQAMGAMALFGEKYGDEVRVVEAAGVSMELCGGTHLTSTGQAGVFVILSETGVAAGIRRIEASTGWNALTHLQSLRDELGEAQSLLKARPGETGARIKALFAQSKDQAKEIEKLQGKLASNTGRDITAEVQDVAGVKLLAIKSEAGNVKALRDQMDALRSKLPSGIIGLVAPFEDGKVSMVVSVSKDLTARFPAPALVKEAAVHVGGSGGGRPDMAQAGGTNAEGIEAALRALVEAVGKG
jgi:alanyl-tRNA synthetase